VVDKGLILNHPFNIMVNAKHIGKNCSIQFGCAFVAGGHDDGIPSIGDNVCFGVGCVVLGDITIASGIAVGANSTVNKSFLEENIGIAGSPARKISNNGSSTWGGINPMR
jgi:serine O-acetyltransferase